ncbi:iron complex outermembrane receptor protein [Kushneria sinocarnis]|uniref:Iron complex outermembrane receptor protein n=1 Tax=Kushneria sinocarnis TaxID=595502 RepID=A0A420WXT5_9GAMM|nr:TonB-dependent receptor [Kushneria sinocarnis]RKR04503.1 iron complex outermembrane receptor protein [Kushneria sinocarnis]
MACSPLSLAEGDDYVAPPAEESDNGRDAVAPAAAAPSGDTNEEIAAPAAPAAVAADGDTPTRDLGRVEVTGSAIARTDAETAVPVTIIQADEIKQQGITSTEELVSQLSSNDTSFGPGLSTGTAITAGASFANLRGIGTDKTLVLLNGRRLANNSLDGGAVDLNTIPFGAIERVEVLRDGASAIYGTDAIGGVINFITKKNLSGGDIEFGYETPTQGGGGDSNDISATWGNGDLEEDGFNIMGSLSYRKQNHLDYTDRDSIREIYDPASGIYSVSSYAYPANYYQGDISGNPLAASGCNGTGLVDTGGGTCSYDYGRYGQVQQDSEKTSLYTRASARLAENHSASLSYLWSRSKNTSLSAPSPTSSAPEIQPGTPFYPDDPALDPTQPVSVRWRGIPAGARETYNTIDAKRLVLDFTGDFSGFNYDSAVSWNRSTTDLDYRGGYLSDDDLENAFNDGLIDPFSTDPLTEAGQQALADAEASGLVWTAQTDVYAWDGKLSREIGDWFGAGSSAIAVGGDYRHERLKLDTDADVASRATSGGLSPDASVNEDRDVKGVYSELNVPLIDGLEITAAVRYDDYSDVGDTTNPKISFRYQPVRQLLIRGAYSEGFRAPTLYELYDPQALTFSPSGLSDPQLCPGGTPANGGVATRDCNTQFQEQQGGNEDLEPEEARNWTLGFVFQPFDSFSAGLDFWWVEIENEVSAPTSAYVIANDPGSIARNDDGSIDYIPVQNQNLGKTKTNGVDISANYRKPTTYGLFTIGYSGTYVDRYDFQESPDSSYVSNVGHYRSGYGTIFRWKHKVTFNWARGQWAAGLINHYQSGYDDYDTETHDEVGSYTTWDALASYMFMAGPRITLGVKNMFDRDPPFSNQPEVGQSGYDARYADALGRTVYARLNYTF